jgi:hypothetical protein
MVADIAASMVAPLSKRRDWQESPALQAQRDRDKCCDTIVGEDWSTAILRWIDVTS